VFVSSLSDRFSDICPESGST